MKMRKKVKTISAKRVEELAIETAKSLGIELAEFELGHELSIDMRGNPCFRPKQPLSSHLSDEQWERVKAFKHTLTTTKPMEE